MIEIQFSAERPEVDALVVALPQDEAESRLAGISVNLLRANRGEFGAVTNAVDDQDRNVWIVGAGKRAELTALRIEQIGAHAVRHGLTSGAKSACLDMPCLPGEPASAVALATGAVLASYRFDKYRQRSAEASAHKQPTLAKITIVTPDAPGAERLWRRYSSIVAGAFMVRDLVNEPPNILTPPEFARRIEALRGVGLTVEILSEGECAELGMGALVSVGRASAHDSKLVILRWNGADEGEAPVAFAGKGVTFDTGGISIKAAEGMQEMKADMGGAAAIVGAMYALAARKARVNAVAAVGLVENMPSGDAYRPGDIVTSMSGQTIEITNTDAEGRLVLCDAMHLLQERFAPRALIDMATLTGVAMMALGYGHAAIFSNDDALAAALEKAGRDAHEPVWRLPLGPAYDAAIDSKVADMKNAAGRLGGAITAAQFLQRFVTKGTPWVHIDMGGAVQVPSGDFKSDDPRMPSWATGWGVRLLDQLMRDQFESQASI